MLCFPSRRMEDNFNIRFEVSSCLLQTSLRLYYFQFPGIKTRNDAICFKILTAKINNAGDKISFLFGRNYFFM